MEHEPQPPIDDNTAQLLRQQWNIIEVPPESFSDESPYTTLPIESVSAPPPPQGTHSTESLYPPPPARSSTRTVIIIALLSVVIVIGGLAIIGSQHPTSTTGDLPATPTGTAGTPSIIASTNPALTQTPGNTLTPQPVATDPSGTPLPTMTALTPTIAATATPYPSLAVSGLQVFDGDDWFIQNDLQASDQAYSDKNSPIKNVPSALVSAIWIQTAYDSRKSNNDPLAQFRVNRPVTVYITEDVSQSWLADWHNTQTTMEYGNDIWKVYSKNFPAGIISLPKHNDSFGMYVIVIVATP